MRDVKLPAVDYYSGGGGGMIGAKGFFEHRHAVEMDPAACQTLK
jgi:site-specific DNA-cytosine methylase